MLRHEDQVGREDLENIYINLDKRKTPFLSSLPRGEKLGNVEVFSWTTGRYLDNRDNILVPGVPEGQDVKNFTGGKQRRLSGRPQKFRRAPMVSDEANEITENPGNFGKFMSQVNIETLEQKRNIDKRLLSDADSKDEDGPTGREFMGAGRFINDAISVGSSGAALLFTDTATSIPVDLRTPTEQIYVGNLNSYKVATDEYKLIFDRAALSTMLLSKQDRTGSTDAMHAFVDARLKSHFADLVGFQRTQVGYTATGQTMYNAVASKNLQVGAVDYITSEYGDIAVTMDPFMPRTSTGALSGRGYIFDMEYLAMRPTGIWLRFTKLENQGGGPRGYLDTIAGPRWGHPQAHLKIDPNVVTGTFA